MSILSKLAGKKAKVDIGGVNLEIGPLRVKDLDLFVMMEDPSQKAQAMALIVKKTLKDSVPDATDEEIENIGVEYFVPLMKAIQEVNGIASKAKADLLEKVRDVQSGSTAA